MTGPFHVLIQRGRCPISGLVLMIGLGSCTSSPELMPPEPGFERMIEQSRGAPYREDPTDPDRGLMRAPPVGTVSRDGLETGSQTGPATGPERTGLGPDGYLRHLPFHTDQAVIDRGADRFAMVCAACHGLLGDGTSAVADHMDLVRPRNLHDPRIRAYPVGQIVHVITVGYGLMAPHADILSEHDRWAVAAYVKVLQLSQHAVIADLPEPHRQLAREHLP